jgi:hypothetical protein
MFCREHFLRDMIAVVSTYIGRIKYMTEGLGSIVAQLEHQKTAIEQALAALREVEGVVAPAAASSSSSAPAKRRGRPKGSGGNRRSEGQKKRWAAKKAAVAAPPAASKKTAPRKPQFTPEGLRKLAEAMKRRWAVKRAAAKKAGRKRATKKVA